MATKAAATKTPAKATNKTAAKAAPKPTKAQAADEVAAIEVGSFVRFLGYGPDVPEDEQYLTVDGEYEVVELLDDGLLLLAMPNPDYNPKKKAHPETNPEFVDVETFENEVELLAAEDEGEGEETEEVEDAEATKEVEEAPSKTADKKTKTKAETKAKDAAPAATKAATKTATKTAAKAPAAKAPAKAAPRADVAEGEDNEYADLANEDPDVLALVESSDDLIATAQELEGQAATTEYQLGGVLRHIAKTKAYLTLEDAADFEGPGGFQTFVKRYFNIDYRKAMYLIQIYTNFSNSGIENPAERVAAIGWTKAAKIAPRIAVAPDEIEDLLQLAEENTVADLSTALVEQAKIGGKAENGERVTRTTMKFRMVEDDGSSVLAILQTAQAQYGLKDINEALYQVATEWATQNAGGVVEAEEETPKQTAPRGRAASKSKATA